MKDETERDEFESMVSSYVWFAGKVFKNILKDCGELLILLITSVPMALLIVTISPFYLLDKAVKTYRGLR